MLINDSDSDPIPRGSHRVDLNLIPPGMRNHLLKLSRTSQERVELGLLINNQFVTCLINDGDITCHQVNKCVMVKTIRKPQTQLLASDPLIRSADVSVSSFLIDDEVKAPHAQVANLDQTISTRNLCESITEVLKAQIGLLLIEFKNGSEPLATSILLQFISLILILVGVVPLIRSMIVKLSRYK
jgi:hypothetical protein